MELKFSRYNPLSSGTWIKAPKSINYKKAIINPMNLDNCCFMYAIGCRQFGHNTAFECRPHLFKATIEGSFNWSGIDFPTPLNQIPTFEANNNISVNVFGLDKSNKVILLQPSARFETPEDRCWDLLYLKGANGNSHYAYIKDLSKLIHKQMDKHDGRTYICRACFSHYQSEEALKEHRRSCAKFKEAIAVMPSTDHYKNFAKFELADRKKKEFVPYTIYADLECILRPLSTNTPNCPRYTQKKQRHDVSMYAYQVVSRNPRDPQTNHRLHLYRGPNAIHHFWSAITAEVKKIGTVYHNNVPMRMTLEEEEAFNQTMHHKCHICEKDIPEGEAVRDHCHLTGKCLNINYRKGKKIRSFYDIAYSLSIFIGRYRGPACNVCNTKYTLPKFVPIVFHNGSGYDMKFLVKEMTSGKPARPPNPNDVNEDDESPAAKRRRRTLATFDDDDVIEECDDDDFEDDSDGEETTPTGRQKKACKRDIKVIATSAEKFVTFSKQIPLEDRENYLEVRFIDSLRFLNSSLQALAKNVPRDKMRNVRRAFSNARLFELATRKGVYPYEYITDESKYNEPCLPPHEAFYSSLTGENIDETEYTFAQTVFREFECANLGEYTDLYLKIDVLLLADIFEHFRDECGESYQLDPCWFVSLPGFAWKAALKTSNIWIELITDYDMLLFFENSIRGGFCFAGKRYAKANHASLPSYNPEEPLSWILYLDANNLYGMAMSQPLPYRNYKWLTIEELDDLAKDGGRRIREESCKWVGYTLEVDLEYPPELHDLHNDLPLCPKRIIIGETGNDSKLTATLHNKERYTV
jgi:hypothetical protein